jgi:hypothetical protein
MYSLVESAKASGIDPSGLPLARAHHCLRG